MRFEGLDLNLLVALDVLLDTQNVTEASRRLNLSQPSVRPSQQHWWTRPWTARATYASASPAAQALSCLARAAEIAIRSA